MKMTNNRLDVFEILGQKNTDNQLDVFRIMAESNVEKQSRKVGAIKKSTGIIKQNQEQIDAPDLSLSVEMLERLQKTGLKPIDRAEPAPVIEKKPMLEIPPKEPAPVIEKKPMLEIPPKKPAPVIEKKPMLKIPKEEPAPAVPLKKNVEKDRVAFGKKCIKVGIAIAVISMLMIFVVGFQKVSVDSMGPLIGNGDTVIVSKLTSNLQKGDIVVFKTQSGEKGVARIVASKGDVVTINNSGGLYINNSLQQEENINVTTVITDEMVSYPVIVEEGSFFVLGDNRTDSTDSRNSEVGLVDEDEIIGKVIFCFKKIS